MDDSDLRECAARSRATLNDFVDVMGDTMDVLARQRDSIIDVTHQLDGGSAMETAVSSINISEQRASLTTALDRLETSRRDARLMMFRQLHAEGCSIGKVARIYGVSRQLASRVLRNEPAILIA